MFHRSRFRPLGRDGDCRRRAAPRQCAGRRNDAESRRRCQNLARFSRRRIRDRRTGARCQSRIVEPWHIATLCRAEGKPGVGRMTTSEAHQAAVTGMLATLDHIQDERLADRLTIYRRGGEIIGRFDWTIPPRANEPRARELVERERSRALTPEEAPSKQSEIARDRKSKRLTSRH